MVNHKEILRLKSLGLTHREIVDAAGCGRNTVTRTLTKCLPSPLNTYRIPSKNLLQKTVKLGTYLCTKPVHLNAAGEEKVRCSTEQLERVQVEQPIPKAQEIR